MSARRRLHNTRGPTCHGPFVTARREPRGPRPILEQPSHFSIVRPRVTTTTSSRLTTILSSASVRSTPVHGAPPEGDRLVVEDSAIARAGRPRRRLHPSSPAGSARSPEIPVTYHGMESRGSLLGTKLEQISPRKMSVSIHIFGPLRPIQ